MQIADRLRHVDPMTIVFEVIYAATPKNCNWLRQYSSHT